MNNRSVRAAKAVDRRQVLRFYPRSIKQRENYRFMDCAAMFTYLTDFRSSETHPFIETGLSHDALTVLSTKRKKRQIEVLKIRELSTRLRVVVARALDRANTSNPYLSRTDEKVRGAQAARVGIKLEGRSIGLDSHA